MVPVDEEHALSVPAAAPLVHWRADRQGRVVGCSGNGLAQLGLEPASLIGRSALLLADDQAAMIDIHRRVLAGESVSCRINLQGRPFALVAWAAQDSLDFVAVDITETDAMAEPEPQVVVLAPSDIRGPLAGISGFCQLLLGRWDELDDQVRKECISRLARQAEQLKQSLATMLSEPVQEAHEIRLHLTEHETPVHH